MENILSYSPEELKVLMTELGEPSYRAQQIFTQLHKGIMLCEMTNVGKVTKQKLKERLDCSLPHVKRKLTSKIDGTVKYLFELYDGNCIESVVMEYKHGHTICVSSQVGCRMGCKFCASTLAGRVRDLCAGEILGQVLVARAHLCDVRPDWPILRNLVFMGMGEPLLNLSEVMRALQSLNNDKGLNFSPRRITVSTCGIQKGLKDLGESGLAYLAVSLHAPSQDIRARIMPRAARWHLDDLLAALKAYPLKTRERITFEYLLLGGINDQPEHAEALARLVGAVKGKLNLIVYNNTPGSPYQAPGEADVLAFEQILWKRHITAIIRKSKGSDINAACGQLKAANSI